MTNRQFKRRALLQSLLGASALGSAGLSAGLTACGGGGGSSSNSESANDQPEKPPIVPPNDSSVPYRVVLEDHRNAAKPLDVGALVLDKALSNDSFAHPVLRQQSSGWDEYGRSGAAVILDGIEFDAWRFSLHNDGLFAGANAHRVLVLTRAMDLKAGVFGSPMGKRTYAPPFKLRVENAQGQLLARSQMRDALPMNDASLVQDPRFFNSETPADLAKVMRRHVCVGMALPIFIGGEPFTPVSVQNYLPRAKTGSLAMPTYLSKVRAAVNGSEMMVLSGNGNAHPHVVPRWPLSRQQIDSLGYSIPTQDFQLAQGNGARTWESALSYGWDYEPGAYGGITNRGGPGGVRGDRAAVPPELLQFYLTAPEGTRAHDGAKHADMARAFLRNSWNYPTYRHAGSARLNPIDAITYPFKAPAASPAGDNDPRPQIVAGYYNRGNKTFEDPNKTPNAIWAIDSYGDNDGTIWADNINPLDKRHPTGGWGPDGEHSNRLNGLWGAWLLADPIYARMQEFLMAEVAMDYPSIDQSITEDSYNPYGFNYSKEPGSEYPGFNRSVVLRWNNLAAMWASATVQGSFTRALCEERLRAIAKHFYLQYAVAMPADDNSVERLGWHRYQARIVWDTKAGWCMDFAIYTQYIAELLLVAKGMGLLDVLRNQGTIEQKKHCVYWIDSMVGHIRNIDEWMVRCPWHVSQTDDGQLRIVMRSIAQGALQSNLDTIPSAWAQISTNSGTNPRSDGVWHVGANGQRNNDANYMREMSLKIAYVHADYFRAKSAERDTALKTLQSRLNAIDRFTQSMTQEPRARAGESKMVMLLHAWPQSVPVLDV